jgi:hypothetical protein
MVEIMTAKFSTGKAFSANKLNIPAQQKICSTDIGMPFFFSFRGRSNKI